MKTYKIAYLLLALVVVGCNKSDDSSGQGGGNKSIDADYTLLMSNGSTLNAQFLNANAEVVTLNPAQSNFVEKALPQLTYSRGAGFLQYHKTGNCGGEITKHDFSNDVSTELEMFADLSDCDLTATTIAESSNSIFIGYEVEKSSMANDYLVRVIDLNTTDNSFVDVTLDKKPVDLEIANNRLFILTLDEAVTGENSLSVMDLNTNTLIIEMGLGYDAQRIFRNIHDDIIISYSELHTTLNSSTMDFVYTQYSSGTEPQFVSSNSNHFDPEGKLYYPMSPGSNSIYPVIPAVYDFSQNLVILYAYENFLTEAKRDFEFEIETTTTVSYDEKNNLMLIGYKKTGGSNKGGLLRIKPAPEPAFVDNLDLDGIPYGIFID